MTRTVRRAVRFAVCCLCLWLLPTSQAAADPAEDLYKQGLAAYRAGNYPVAIAKFQASFDAKQVPKILIDIGLSYLKLGNGQQAQFFFRYYLREDLRVPPTARADIEAYIAQAQSLSGETSQPKTPPTRSQVVPTSARTIQPTRPIPRETRQLPDAEEEDEIDSRSPRARQVPPVPAPLPPPPALPVVETPRLRLVTVGFFAADRETKYDVSSVDSTCTTPCILKLPPGLIPIDVKGPVPFQKQILIPNIPVKVELRHLTKNHIIAGSVLMGLSPLPVGIGLGLLQIQADGGGAIAVFAVSIVFELGALAMVIGGIAELAQIRGAKAEVTPLSGDERAKNHVSVLRPLIDGKGVGFAW